DFDLDGTSDCLDPDDDNDLVDDAADCAPMDASAFGLPMEVTDLLVTDSGQTEISWTEQSIGSGTLYDVASGQIAEAGLIDFPSGNCLGSGTASPAIDSRALPPPDTAWYYLVRSRNSCGHGTYGSAERDTHPACP
ncbi:MAG TPA: hypothetical protein VFP98_00160, partial [Candidatus Polarisedimenticolia bacterium]|nr:hypothetical protein [Candidatus Polarisedimenticolia bacterium]